MKRTNNMRNILLLSQGFIIAAFAMLSPIYAIFVEKMEGEYTGAVGLPLFVLTKELKKLGVRIL